MVASGELQLKYPEQPTHPDQTYRTHSGRKEAWFLVPQSPQHQIRAEHEAMPPKPDDNDAGTLALAHSV